MRDITGTPGVRTFLNPGCSAARGGNRIRPIMPNYPEWRNRPAADGLEALELVEQLDPDVVLMDVSMPRMDGTRATRLITSACPAVKVIGLSMHDDDWMARTMLEAGASGYLEKAAELDTLIDTIRDVAQDQFAAAGG